MVLGAEKEGTSCGVGSCSSTATTTDFVLGRTKTCLVRTLLCLGLVLCFSYLKDCYTILRLETTLGSMSLEHERMSIEATHGMNSRLPPLIKGVRHDNAELF
jgi:hypothetical protein